MNLQNGWTYIRKGCPPLGSPMILSHILCGFEPSDLPGLFQRVLQDPARAALSRKVCFLDPEGPRAKTRDCIMAREFFFGVLCFGI